MNRTLTKLFALTCCLVLLLTASAGCGIGGIGGGTTEITGEPIGTLSPETTVSPAQTTGEQTGHVTSPPDTTAAETTSPVTTVPETTSAPEPEVSKVSFAACGDNIVYLAGVYDAKNRAVTGGRTYNFRIFYRNVEERIAAADIAMINQESLMAGASYGYSGYPAFNSPQDLALDLIDVGFDVVSLANNHMLDMGSAGLISTIKYWNTLPVMTVGGYLGAEDAARIRVMEKNGIRIAFLAYTNFTNYKFDGNTGLSIPYLDKTLVQTQIAEARRIADVVVVTAHWWREENNTEPNASQKEMAQLMCDCGVDIIIGHHPHVLQPIEVLKSSDGGHTTLCAYSLGNFSANMGYDYNALGGILTFNVNRTVYPDGREPTTVTVTDIEFHPTVNYFDVKCYNNEIFYLSDFTAAMCSSHGVVTRRAAGNKNYGGVMTLTRLFGYLDKTVIDYVPAVYTAARPQ